MKVRKMREDDLFLVAALERSTSSMPWSVESFRAALNCHNNVFFVAEEDGSVIGYTGMLCVVDEGQILNVAVEATHRRQGIAKQLIEALFDAGYSWQLCSYTLEVRAGNKAAIALYNKLGFHEVGRRNGYYKKPEEDAILMSTQQLPL